MTISGTGCFVAWYDLKPGQEAEHDHWHTHEHMIERVAIPGFRRGFRYRSVAGSPRVCGLYHVDSIETLTSPAYLERLNNPTPWSSRSLPLFVGMNRTLCAVASSHGHGIGGFLLSIQLAPRAGCADGLRGWIAGQALPDCAARAGLCGAHLLVADRTASQLGTKEKQLRGEPDRVADWVVLIEGYDLEAVEQAQIEMVGSDGLTAHGAEQAMESGLYRLDFTIGEDEAKAIWRKPTT